MSEQGFDPVEATGKGGAEIQRLRAQLAAAGDLLGVFVAEFVREFYGTDYAEWGIETATRGNYLDGDEFISDAADEALWKLADSLSPKGTL